MSSYPAISYPRTGRDREEGGAAPRYVSPYSYNPHLFPNSDHHSRYSTNGLTLSAKAQGKQRKRDDDGYDSGDESSVPSSEMADLCLENGRYPPNFLIPLGSQSPVFSPDRSHYNGHARPPGPMSPRLPLSANPVLAPPHRPSPPPHPTRPMLLPPSPHTPPDDFVPGRNPRGRPKSTSITGADRDERENGAHSGPKTSGRVSKRPAEESDEDGDDDWDPTSEAAARGNASTSPADKKKRRKTNRYPCLISGCKETFTRKNDVRRHVMNAAIHRDSPEALQLQGKPGTRCKLCNADLSRADARMRHERTSACGKRTTQKMKDQMIVMRLA
ncbi:hypothetical protein V5O48_000726 [Marasmius crinis-equi]|uniref:C2H2-type domain-containing protein n=1 Tax=Marasmius crinis-equi TaxID=585013 RepID=A0ABR3G0I4_9AGAR